MKKILLVLTLAGSSLIQAGAQEPNNLETIRLETSDNQEFKFPKVLIPYSNTLKNILGDTKVTDKPIPVNLTYSQLEQAKSLFDVASNDVKDIQQTHQAGKYLHKSESEILRSDLASRVNDYQTIKALNNVIQAIEFLDMPLFERELIARYCFLLLPIRSTVISPAAFQQALEHGPDGTPILNTNLQNKIVLDLFGRSSQTEGKVLTLFNKFIQKYIIKNLTLEQLYLLQEISASDSHDQTFNLTPEFKEIYQTFNPIAQEMLSDFITPEENIITNKSSEL